ncbi:alginate lyase, partial [Alishewanella sp. SMS9]|nr:alginate lyase [Alishewanella sp. SMS9]
TKNGYQHLWLKGRGLPKQGLAKVSWLNENGRFYTHTSLVDGQEEFLFTQIGANDPHFNLRNEQAFVRRVENSKQHHFISVLEPHGEYNPSEEYTLDAESQLTELGYSQQDELLLVDITIAGKSYLIAINQAAEGSVNQQFQYQHQSYVINGRLAVFALNDDEE